MLVGVRHSLTTPCLPRQGSLLRCLYRAYLRHDALLARATPRLRWQGELLIELHRTYWRRVRRLLTTP